MKTINPNNPKGKVIKLPISSIDSISIQGLREDNNDDYDWLNGQIVINGKDYTEWPKLIKIGGREYELDNVDKGYFDGPEEGCYIPMKGNKDEHRKS